MTTSFCIDILKIEKKFKKTKQIYASEEACAADIADPNTETTKDDIQRDLKVFAPKLLGIGASNTVE